MSVRRVNSIALVDPNSRYTSCTIEGDLELQNVGRSILFELVFWLESVFEIDKVAREALHTLLNSIGFGMTEISDGASPPTLPLSILKI